MINFYILDDDNRPVAVDFMTAARWLEANESRCVVEKTWIAEVEVSTVFLHLDHNWSGGGPPVVFETKVFGGQLDGKTDRYSTWEEAKAGHDQMVKRVKRA